MSNSLLKIKERNLGFKDFTAECNECEYNDDGICRVGKYPRMLVKPLRKMKLRKCTVLTRWNLRED